MDPEQAIQRLWLSIAQIGNVQALREASKLLKIDEKRFDRIVYMTLVGAQAQPWNAFSVAYAGLELGDRAIDVRIAEWAERDIADADTHFIDKPYLYYDGGMRPIVDSLSA